MLATFSKLETRIINLETTKYIVFLKSIKLIFRFLWVRVIKKVAGYAGDIF
jgi:hypothetical protein